MCSITGRPTIGTIGFGLVTVRGRRRDPSPPAITTAFISRSSSPYHGTTSSSWCYALSSRRCSDTFIVYGSGELVLSMDQVHREGCDTAGSSHSYRSLLSCHYG